MNFFLPEDYLPNPIRRTPDNGQCEEEYWNEQRIGLSGIYQYGVYELARKTASQHQARTIVDIGCGPATKLMNFFEESFDLVGLDQNNAVEICQRSHSRGTFIAIDLDNQSPEVINELPTADLVICADVIEHVQAPDSLLNLIRSIMNSGSRAVISTPDRDRLHGPSNRQPTNTEHIREWNGQEFRQLLQSHGFQIVQQVWQPHMRLSGISGWSWMLRRLIAGKTRQTNQVTVCKLE